jgi:gliding motility-associated lipoprotein GldH
MRRPNTLLTLFSLTAIVWLTSSCDEQRVFEDNQEFKSRSWMVQEEPVFEFSIPDSTQTYSLYYNVRNSLDYPYARIFVTYALYDSTGRELSKKLVYHDLFDEKSGRPFGESGLGDLYDHQFPLLTKYRFPTRGKYAVKLTQFMRQDTLQGVLAVGVRVERAPAEVKK